MAETKEIISRFYDLHEKPSIIVKELNVKPSYKYSYMIIIQVI